MDKKYIKKYWKEVRRRAWASAWDKSGMKILIPFLIVVVGASALGGLLLMFGWVEYPFFRDNLIANSLTGLSQLFLSVVILVYLFISLVYQIPPKIHIEQEERIRELEPQKAKVDIVENSKQTYAEGNRVSLSVINRNSFDLIKCHAKLVFIAYHIGSDRWFQEPKEWHMKNLFWSSRGISQDGTITISANGGEEALDVIEVGDDLFNILFYNNGIQVGFDWKDKGLTAGGDYLLQIKVYGNVGDSLQKPIIPIEAWYAVHFQLMPTHQTKYDANGNIEDYFDPTIVPRLQIRKVEINAKAEAQEKDK